MSGLSFPTGLSPDQGLAGSQGLSIGDGLSFQQLGPVGENGILLENRADFLMLEDNISILLQE
jgi:hypothetical protein